jgi:hypothetical protein
MNALRKLLEAASRVARDPAIVDPLVRSTGLSRENVLLGLSRHLETNATDDELAALTRSVTRVAGRVHVILSPSVFVAPLRAIALGLAAEGTVTVKPSRREAFFSRALVEALDDPRVTLTPDARPEDVREGEIHAYGHDETIAAIRASAHVPVRGHASGMGVALVTGDLAAAAEALAEDVVPFDQRGCLSPRVAFVVGDARAFSRMLFEALESRGKEVPRGTLDAAEQSAFARWADTVTFAGTLHRGGSCAVGVLETVMVPPTGRHMLVVSRASPTLPEIPNLVAVGTDAPDFLQPAVRVSPLGMMQRPPLDGPVDLRSLTVWRT